MSNGEFDFTRRSPDDDESLSEARARVQQGMQEGRGAICPCCDQLVQLRRYKLDAGIAYALTQIYLLGGPDHRQWVHYTDATKIAGNTMKVSLAKHWYLIEKSDEKARTGQRSPAGRKNSRGEWRLPDLGCDFVEGKIAVPQCIWVYNDTCYRKSEVLITIRQALGDHFNYDELMGATRGRR